MRFRVRALLGLCVLAPAAIFSCVGDSPTDGGDGSPKADAASDGTTGSDSPSGDGASCVPGCVADASTLRACNGGSAVDTPCALGCLMDASAHCGVFNPTGMVEPTDFEATGLKDFDPFAADASTSGPYVFHTDTGQIEDFSTGAAVTVRPANSTPAVTQVDGPTGVGFRLASSEAGPDKLGIFVFKSLTMRRGEFHFVGANPVAFVAQSDMQISGVIDVVDTGSLGLFCSAAAGGSAGGANNASATGFGAGEGGTQVTNGGSGGGGGGSGGTGAAGGSDHYGLGLTGGNGGPSFAGGFDPLLGGGGGGGGGGLYTGGGGAGGGAIALFARGTITITTGAGATAGVNAGGCGGAGNGNFTNNGGGGAGGAILIQAPALVGLGDAGVAANGGSGSCGSSLGGVRGTISSTPAPGNAAGGNCGAGGNGGAGATPATTGQAPSSPGYGGGGGGGVGRIQISTYAPLVADGGFVMSPTPTILPLPIE